MGTPKFSPPWSLQAEVGQDGSSDTLSEKQPNGLGSTPRCANSGVVQSWANDRTSRKSGFLICKTGTVTVIHSARCLAQNTLQLIVAFNRAIAKGRRGGNSRDLWLWCALPCQPQAVEPHTRTGSRTRGSCPSWKAQLGAVSRALRTRAILPSEQRQTVSDNWASHR